ncbi:F0F1 ATP synthase subunit B [Chlorobium phaeobacteroides]|jgi:F-type H+-transporting ATPase subunit b|uniref:ATP synthase subunit b n=1 Tax=Chlorobium phaeobacteroides (strain DSM 266 / SMG 266 / 2430) TaxID=290317 RepID=ATPF_CHLPD|nr:F0F1 ATP synthase subunit B [Chlorobium phaeobacteroides]A1BJW4.1 RecName: Full=ATP synthase subunit b; AltName: Full=ATP synthase F(0) sector subunit b; AltName: Full=ATPase subunit I; AltName: Full=F-type ATPase subunit b; Short=F-ATPase subunit b [Chlorobium phaeobacteroides DSM 266]ABL66691.1 ATP synthase F0 subcomplex B subunit [Chlorobium phaeobacteroides DSM 266]MBV5319904.1 F0F1 ATP synthase subunit B [Chlorobium phaeobacteroides]
MLTSGVILLNGGLLSPNPGLIFWTTVSFVIVLLILRKLAWGPIISALEEREKGIQSSIDRAHKAKDEAEEILRKNRELLAKADAESDKIIREGKEYGEKLRAGIAEKAQAEAAKMISMAKEEIEQEKRRALDVLRNEVAELAVMGAEKIIKTSLDADMQKKIVDSMIQDLSTKRN